MSEYWVSKKKYYCQYCEIYIADDAPSRSQHENGLRHKGNKDRFIRGLYKAGVKKKQESEEEKREMKRVEEAAQAAYARDIGAGLATSKASPSAASVTPARPKPPPPKPSDPYANYTTAASLGFTDPDIERLVAEAEVRKSEGRAGDWIAVVPPPPPLPQNGEASTSSGIKADPESGVGEVRKRDEEHGDEDDARHFKLRKKTVSVGLGEIYDPGIITVKPRVDPKVKAEAEVGSIVAPGPTLGGDVPQGDVKREEVAPGPKATVKPTWTRREWKWAGEDQASESSQTGLVDESQSDPPPDVTATREETAVAIKTQNGDAGPQLAANDVVKKEEPTDLQTSLGGSAGGSLFRKRKTPGGTSTRGRRQI